MRSGVEHDARLGADRQPAGLAAGRKHRHVDVGEVEQGQRPAAGRQHLAGLDEPVFARGRRPAR